MGVNKQFIKDALGWGFILWLIGYGLGLVLFSLVPASWIGWIIMPIGTVLTIWVALKKIKGPTLQYYLSLSVVWLGIAVVFDYFFLVRAFRPTDGYYKLDVYIYYILTFVIPLSIGWIKNRTPQKPEQISETPKTESSQTPFCQSCGMPMTKPEDFGTNADGSKNAEYCRYCFQNGKFTDEGITLEGKIAKSIEMAKKMGMPGDEAEKMAKSVLPNLKRWKK